VVTELSVIIVNYRGWKRLKDCLDSLSSITQNKFTFEVIIVDNASNDGILDDFRRRYSSFIFLDNSGNNGFANGCNLGASYAKGELFLFLNSDTIVSEEALYGMIQEMYSRNGSCIVSCRQIKEDGSDEKAYGRFLSPLTLTGWLRAINKIITGNDGRKFSEDSNYIYPDWVSGSVIMIRKTDFLSIGGWDEDYWMYFEDVDLCQRLRAFGGTIIFLKQVVVEHNHGGATRTNSSITALTKTEVLISRHIYISKHAKRFKNLTQTFLVCNNIFSFLITALLGLIFFFNKKVKTFSKIYSGLMRYYLNSLFSKTWLSTRSVNYKSLK
jgi:GT2 family glycosyltransferase